MQSMGQSYLITLEGDSIVGKYSIHRTSVDNEYIRIKADGEKTEFQATEIKKLVDKRGNIYKPIRAEQRFKIGRVEQSGYVNLYVFTSTGSSQSFNQEILIKLDGSSLIVPGMIGFRKSMTDFLFECEEVNTQIEEGEFKKRDLEEIIEVFNDCMETKNSNTILQEERNVGSISNSFNEQTAEFKTLLKYSDYVDNKSDVLDMFNDIIEKIKQNDPIPNYLANLFNNSIAKDEKLTALYQKLKN